MRRSLATDIALGAAAGAAATWLMDRTTTALYEREPKPVKDRENKARGGRTAFEIAAERGADLIDAKLDDDLRKEAGTAIHWSVGIAAGAAYGALRHKLPMRVGSGLAFGTAFWLAVDEAANTLLKLTPSPRAFPWQTHARGLAGHVVHGSAVESVFDVADLISARS